MMLFLEQESYLSCINLVYNKLFECPSEVCSSYIFSAHRKFDYRDKFIHMIEVVYTKIHSETKINGLLSDPFTLYQKYTKDVYS